MLGEGFISENNECDPYCQKSLNKVCFSSAVQVILQDNQAIYMFTTCILVWPHNDASPTFNLTVQI